MSFEIWYTDDKGQRIAPVTDAISFEYASVLGDVGSFRLTVPYRGQPYVQPRPDRRIVFYRKPTAGPPDLDFVGLTQDFTIQTSEQGQTQFDIRGHDLNGLLDRRIVAYYAAESESQKNAPADDLMKAVITENFVNNADYDGTPSPSRSISGAGFSVQPDLGDGPTLRRAFAWRRILPLLQDLQAASKQADNETFFMITPVSEGTMQFRTWTVPRDRTSASPQAMVFSLQRGNLSSPALDFIYADEVTAVYAGGRGEKSDRNVQLVVNTDGLNRSAFGRKERFVQSNYQADTGEDAALQAEAQDELARRRARIQFSGDLLAAPATPYGGLNGWKIGDKVTVDYAGYQFNSIIRAVYVRVFPDGTELIRARVENE
jgi:hypothetical protein